LTIYIDVLCLDIKTSQPGDWNPEREVEDGAGQSGHGEIHLEKICKKWVSVALMQLRVLPVTVPNGNNSFIASVHTGTEGPKSE